MGFNSNVQSLLLAGSGSCFIRTTPYGRHFVSLQIPVLLKKKLV